MTGWTPETRVSIPRDDLTPCPVLCDELLKVIDDLDDQLDRADTDPQRFWLSCALSGAQMAAAALMAHAGNDCARWQTADEIMLQKFGRKCKCR